MFLDCILKRVQSDLVFRQIHNKLQFRLFDDTINNQHVKRIVMMEMSHQNFTRIYVYKHFYRQNHKFELFPSTIYEHLSRKMYEYVRYIFVKSIILLFLLLWFFIFASYPKRLFVFLFIYLFILNIGTNTFIIGSISYKL